MVVQSASRNALSLSAKASGTQPWQVVSVVSQYVVQYSLNSLQSYNHFERWQSIWAKKVVRLCVGGENMQSPPLTPPLRGEGKGGGGGFSALCARKNLTGFCAVARRKWRCLVACFPMLRGESANSPRCVAVSSTLIFNSQLSIFSFILCFV